MRISTLLATGVSLGLLANTASAIYERDHPLFSAYPTAELYRALMYDYEKFTFPLSLVDASKPQAFTPLDLVGDLYLHNYEIHNASSLKVFENYVAAAKQLGFKPLFSCALDSCGDEEQINALGDMLSVHGDIYNNWRKPYYWIGEKDSPKGKIIVAWFVGAYEDNVAVHQVIVEGEPLETGLVKVDATYANQGVVATQVEPLSEADKAEDHPLLPRYPGAKISNHKKVDTETLSLPFAINAADKKALPLTGDLGRHTYTIKNVSTLKVYENYRAALDKAGFSLMSQCELEQCGTEQQVNELGDQVALAGDVYNWYKKPYYLLAKKAQASGDIYVALFIGGYEDTVGVQQVIVEEKAVQTGLVSINVDQLKQQLDGEGKALIYGIYFDTGKAAIKPESKPTLDAIADLLERNSDLLLYVVGHTDDTGDSAANLLLSKQRAEAVVTALIQDYRIASNRLSAQGVGAYAPAANNTSEAGKQKNRRVELVKRLR